MASKRILVVDDDAVIREIVRVSLERVGGYESVAATGGREALVRAREEQPDAILMDVMMPELDGPATFVRLQADPVTRDIPVILLTAEQAPADLAGFAKLGVRAVLAKPFDPTTLASDVAAILGWPGSAAPSTR